jgi:hypothetical protein
MKLDFPADMEGSKGHILKGNVEKLRGGASWFQLHTRNIFHFKAKKDRVSVGSSYVWFSQNLKQIEQPSVTTCNLGSSIKQSKT